MLRLKCELVAFTT